MAWTQLFTPIAPYQHADLSIEMGPWDIPADAKNLRLSVDIGSLEQSASASGHVAVEMSNDGGETWVGVTTYHWHWQNIEGRGGVVSRSMGSSISIPDAYVCCKLRGMSTLDGLYIVGFRLEYET